MWIRLCHHIDLNLYYRVFHDIIEWAIANGYKFQRQPQLRPQVAFAPVAPVDLYVRHTSGPLNAVLKRLLPVMEPTRYNPILPNFDNYRELWG